MVGEILLRDAVPAARDCERHAQEYLTFALGSETYALDILKVQEIRGYDKPTQIANAPPYIKGVINLRGSIVPIVDLRIQFNLSRIDYTPCTVVIILNLGARVIGVVVDGVSDVIILTAAEIRPAPDFSAAFDTQYIVGLATIDGCLIIVADVEKLMCGADMALIPATAVLLEP